MTREAARNGFVALSWTLVGAAAVLVVLVGLS
jgi:hypothetical protein